MKCLEREMLTLNKAIQIIETLIETIIVMAACDLRDNWIKLKEENI